MDVHIEHLCKAYDGKPVLENVSFTAAAGRVTCIMAPSGRGKTTLLRILLGLERADSGTVTLPEHCRWSAVFQEDRLLEHLDAMGNLRFVLGGALYGAAAGRLLAELGLGDTAGKPVREFSGGMKRRLALARALLAPFDLLALDEPFTGLDEDNRDRAWRCVLDRTAGRTVLLVSHELPPAGEVDLVRL